MGVFIFFLPENNESDWPTVNILAALSFITTAVRLMRKQTRPLIQINSGIPD